MPQSSLHLHIARLQRQMQRAREVQRSPDMFLFACGQQIAMGKSHGLILYGCLNGESLESRQR